MNWVSNLGRTKVAPRVSILEIVGAVSHILFVYFLAALDRIHTQVDLTGDKVPDFVHSSSRVLRGSSRRPEERLVESNQAFRAFEVQVPSVTPGLQEVQKY